LLLHQLYFQRFSKQIFGSSYASVIFNHPKDGDRYCYFLALGRRDECRVVQPGNRRQRTTINSLIRRLARIENA